jgi:hypothetical protein
METIKAIIIMLFVFCALSFAQSKDSANIKMIDKQLNNYGQMMQKLQGQNDGYQKLIQKNNENILRMDGIRLFLTEQRKAESAKIDSIKSD